MNRLGAWDRDIQHLWLYVHEALSQTQKCASCPVLVLGLGFGFGLGLGSGLGLRSGLGVRVLRNEQFVTRSVKMQAEMPPGEKPKDLFKKVRSNSRSLQALYGVIQLLKGWC